MIKKLGSILCAFGLYLVVILIARLVHQGIDPNIRDWYSLATSSVFAVVGSILSR